MEVRYEMSYTHLLQVNKEIKVVLVGWLVSLLVGRLFLGWLMSW